MSLNPSPLITDRESVIAESLNPRILEPVFESANPCIPCVKQDLHGFSDRTIQRFEDSRIGDAGLVTSDEDSVTKMNHFD